VAVLAAMHDVVDQVRRKFEMLRSVMDERVTRLWAAAEALALGRGGSAIVTVATGIRSKRVWLGKRELAGLPASTPEEKAQDQRIRRPGAGRKRLVDTDKTLLSDLELLVEPVTRGDPESALRWTTKSTYKLANELAGKGHKVGPRTVAALLHRLGYSLQAPKKTREGRQHPDRNAQFEHIAAETKAFQAANQPVVSVDTKKKELVGDFYNKGCEWQPKGEPEPVRVHDFVDAELGKAIPYGVYDVTRNEAWVSVGIDHDTSAFAAASVERWWTMMGKKAYPEATEVLIVADGGGSNGVRTRLWKTSLQDLADKTGLIIHVSHLPPGTSKWNKIEHRLFSHIGMNWRGRPLVSHEVIVKLIAGTTTKSGLKVRAKLDLRKYPAGLMVLEAEMAALCLDRNAFHGEWNYVLRPRNRS
jgi:transposase